MHKQQQQQDGTGADGQMLSMSQRRHGTPAPLDVRNGGSSNKASNKDDSGGAGEPQAPDSAVPPSPPLDELENASRRSAGSDSVRQVL